MSQQQDEVLLDRRKFLASGLTMVAGGVLASVIPTSANADNSMNRNILSTSKVNPTSVADVKFNDGLAHAIPYQPKIGTGKERGIALGGGGIYLLSFNCGYFHGLLKNGIDLSNADVVVGTSAGSIAGAMLTGHHLKRLEIILNIFVDYPKIFADLVPPLKPNLSQERAIKLSLTTREATPDALQQIGRGAMASRNPNDADGYYKAMHKLIGIKKWPSPALYTTANDCYTGERIIVSASSNIDIDVACAASSSLPGKMGPTWLHDRLCMDGGICQTSTHCDVIAGVKRALVFSLGDGTPNEITQGLRTSAMPDTLNQEIADLRANGTQVIHVVAGLLPGYSKIDSIMDPTFIAPMLKYGYERALQDAAKIKELWR